MQQVDAEEVMSELKEMIKRNNEIKKKHCLIAMESWR